MVLETVAFRCCLHYILYTISPVSVRALSALKTTLFIVLGGGGALNVYGVLYLLVLGKWSCEDFTFIRQR